jgi:hypothetical protein
MASQSQPADPIPLTIPTSPLLPPPTPPSNMPPMPAAEAADKSASCCVQLCPAGESLNSLPRPLLLAAEELSRKEEEEDVVVVVEEVNCLPLPATLLADGVTEEEMAPDCKRIRKD